MDKAKATRSTYKGHGKPEMFVYFGQDNQLDGDIVRASGRRGGNDFISVETGRRYRINHATKFWAAPLS